MLTIYDEYPYLVGAIRTVDFFKDGLTAERELSRFRTFNGRISAIVREDVHRCVLVIATQIRHLRTPW
jgi:hypothetical protein